MNIIETNLNFNSLTYNNNPTRIVLHHAEASSCTIEDINSWHKNNGWAGVGYHYFVRKDGSIYRGRPEDAQGAHCPGANTNSIGICFEGAYMSETMGQVQYDAGQALIADIRNRNGGLPIYGHKELYSTDCPGTNFPLDNFKNNASTNQPQISISSTEDQISKGKEFIGVRCSELQEKLSKLGYYSGQVDGDFGPKTYEALTTFQSTYGLFIDGLAGEQTFSKLDMLINAYNVGCDVKKYDEVIKDLQYQCNKQGFSDQVVDGVPGPITLKGCPTLDLGSQGEITRCLQKLLNRRGYNLVEDGDFGDKTLNVVMNFQAINNLSQDGVVGQNTWRALLGL